MPAKPKARTHHEAHHEEETALVNSKANLVGLLRIMHELNLVEDYDIYTPKLLKATKKAPAIIPSI